MFCKYCGYNFEKTDECLVYQDGYYCNEECLHNEVIEYSDWAYVDDLED